MKFGYCRVSTYDQNPELQLDALLKAGVPKKNIFVEKISGIKADRPELNKLKSKLREGDALVIWKLDRLARSTKDLLAWGEILQKEGVDFISLTESLNTSVPFGKFTFTVLAAITQLERDIISERTIAGLVAARKRGLKGGRKFTHNKIQRKSIVKSYYDNHDISISGFCRKWKVSKSTLYRYINEFKLEKNTTNL